MSIRESRIPHPPGSQVIIAHKWIAAALGKAAAMIMGHLDYLDRVKGGEGEPLATRAGLIAALEGFVGKNAIDENLKTLVEIGWVVLIEQKSFGDNNLRQWHEYAIDVDAIGAWLAQNRETRRPGFGKPGVPVSGPVSGRGIQEEVNKEVDTDTEPGGVGGVGDQSQDQNPIPAQGGRGSCGSAALAVVLRVSPISF